MNPALRIEDLGKSFTVHQLGKHIRACTDVHLELGHGEFGGITGKSGSGKSTVLKMIYRTYLPEGGKVWYDSARFGLVDISRIGERDMLFLRRHEIGYVSQFLNVPPRSTAREIVEQAAVETGDTAESSKEKAAEMLRHFELGEELWDSYVSTFSGGEKLRLNVARAMIKGPRLLLLDEPTASLDSHSKGKVRELIERLKAQGTTMLGIFHDLEFMDGLCDRTYGMAAGKLEEFMTC
ncbi:MAG: ATP-binding cassette domain-containing protein [Candidatus Competibacteraceae bacterium]|nr:ATP-binding cassette domain-containing protein [Candidatus Competibacteraceae bacterium]